MQAQEQGIPSASFPNTVPGRLRGWLSAALTAEAHAWGRVLRWPPLYGVLGVLLLGFVLAAHLPLHYSIDVGIEEGYGGDLPHLRAFNTAERDEHGTYRWTRDRARIVIPGLGQRGVHLRLDFFPISPEAVAQGPDLINLWIGEEQLAALPVQRAGASYLLRVPDELLQGGTLDITIRTHTFVPANPDDPRSLGTPLDRITVSAPGGGFFIAPDWGAVLLWLGAALLVWATVLRALEAVPGARWWALGFVGGPGALLLLASVLDPARWAFGAQPALVAALWSYLLVLLLRPAFAALAARLDIPLTPRTLGWLLLIVVLAFGLRYGGRLYPRSMHGDIGFHTNRFNEVTWGQVFLLSRNRGVDFPYPPGPYVMLAPLALVRPDPPYLLQLGAALVEGLSAALIYAIVARAGKACADWRARAYPAALHATGPPTLAGYTGTALLAASIYVFTAAGFMTTWWSFDTHIYTQFFTLLLLAAVNHVSLHRVLYGSRERGALHPAALTLVLFVLCALVFLGHFGFFINTVLLGGLMLLIICLAAWRKAGWARPLGTALALAGVGAGIVAFLLFYGYYIPLFRAQAQVAASGGLTELANRPPVERAYLWRVLWDAGFVQHFGFFPLLLAPVGVWLLARWGRPAWVTATLIGGSFAVSAVFAVLPFLTLSTQSTRWLMFSAWGVAIGAAVAARWLWRRGAVGRLAVVVMAGFVLWNTVVLWLGPMLWRIRPPEPF
jgi:hypothetical protein